MNYDLVIELPDTVHAQIERFLRNQILSGKLKQGELLPSTSELAKRWRVHNMTIQAAMAPLVREGLIHRKPRRGTFVRSGSAQGMIGVLIRSRLMEETSCFSRAMLRSIQSEIIRMKGGPWACRYYDDLPASFDKSDFRQKPMCRQFVADFQNNPFKGLIQINSKMMDIEKLIPGLNLPVVRLGLFPKLPGVDVVLDYGLFAEEAVRLVARQGAKNIVYFCAVPFASDKEGLAKGIKAAGLPQPFVCRFPGKINVGAIMEHDAYAETLRMIGQWRKDNRWPDALIISDDIAARGVALALIGKAGHKAAKMQVVTLSNEEDRYPYGIPLVRYVFSPLAVARELLNILGKRIAGEALPPLPVIIRGRLDFSLNKA